MKILSFSAYFTPEEASSMYLTENIFECFCEAGNEVDLFVPTPTRGVTDDVRKKYKKLKKELRHNGRMTVHRITLMREKESVVPRFLRYILMNVLFIFRTLFKKWDVIFVQSTPPTQGAMAAIIKKIKKIPFVYNLQDIFPDSLVGAGLTNEESKIYKTGRKIEDFTYRNADRIIVVSNDMKNNIMNKGVPEEKITVVSNWADCDGIEPIDKAANYLFDELSIDRDEFNIVYAGNLGYAQNIEVVIDAAKILENEKGIAFYIFGTGAQEQEYKKYAEEKNVTNLKFFPIRPYEEVSYVYSLGDACIVSCKKGFGGSAMPSKTWSIMACGSAVLASFDSGTDLEKLVIGENIGLFSEAENAEALAENIKTLFNNVEVCSDMGKNARIAVKTKGKESGTSSYFKAIKSVVK